jgi:tetratricopeptide (TPR) repeat protein
MSEFEENSSKIPSGMSIRELKAAIREAGLQDQTLGFTEKHEYVSLLENHYAAVVASIGNECPICFNSKDPSGFAMLPCGHTICSHCLSTIHNRAFGGHPGSSDSCPFCRGPIPESARLVVEDASTILLSARNGTRSMAEAQAKFERGLELDPTNLGALTTLADMYSEIGDFNRAIALCRRAIIAHPESWIGFATLAGLYADQDLTHQATSCYEKALSLNENGGVLSSYGNLLYRTGDVERAISVQRRSVAVSSRDSLLIFNLAVSLDESNTDLDEAIVLYKRAIELAESPEDLMCKQYLQQFREALAEVEAKKRDAPSINP